MTYRKRREDLSVDGIACDAAFSRVVEGSFAAAAAAGVGQRYTKY